MLPLGLPPALHAVCAASVPCTLQQDPTLPDDLQFAVNMSSGTYVDVSVKQLARLRRTALRDFKRQVGHLAEEIKPLFTDRYGMSASFLKRMAYPERIAAAAASIAWPEALLACGGARLVGEVERAFIYRPTHIDQKWSTGELLRTPTYKRYASFRVFDNVKSGGHNGSTEAYERIHTCGSAASVALVREFTRLIIALVEGNYTLLQGTQDMKKAFRQITIQDESSRFCVIAVWHPQNGCWKFFQMFAMLFGFMAAVLQFNRVSGLLVALARRWIALPVLGYFDDFKYIVLAGGGGGCSNVRRTAVPVDQAIFEVLVSWLGYVLDPMKMQPLATHIKILGTMERVVCVNGHDWMHLFPDGDKIQKINDFISEVLSKKKVPLGTCARHVAS